MNKVDLEVRNQNVGFTRDVDKLREHNKVELEKISEQHQKQKEVTKASQDELKIQLINESEQKKVEELSRRETQLNDIKASVEKTKKILHDEKGEVENSHRFQMHEKKDHQRIQNQAITDQQNHHIKETNSLYNKRLGQIHFTGEKGVRLENESQRLHLRKVQAEGHQQINGEEERFHELYRLSEKRHKDQIDHLDFMQNIQLQEKENLHKIKLLQKQKYFEEELGKQESDQKLRLISNKNEFDVKYANIHQQFEDNLKQLGQKVDHSMGQLKLGLTEQINLQQARSNDPFYSLPTLSPSIVEREKDYVVRVPVNDLDKGQIQIAVNDKSISISFNRNFDEKIEDEHQGESRVSKVETFKKTEKVAHFLDAKKIKKSYDNGVMTYIIDKKT